MSSFDPYEYVGYIVPGAVLLLGPLLFCRWVWEHLKKDSPVKAIASFLIVTFVLGHLLHASSHWVETRLLGWCEGGVYGTNAVVSDRGGQDLLSSDELTKLADKVEKSFGVPMATLDLRNERDHLRWCNAIMRMNSEVHFVKRGGYLDILIKDYGFYLGLAIAFGFLIPCLLLGAIWPRARPDWIVHNRNKDLRWGLFFAFLGPLVFVDYLAWWRLQYFGRLYARELFLSFLA